MTYTARQISNGLTILQAAVDWHGKRDGTAKRLGRLAVQCCLVESNLHNYANPAVPGSLAYPYDPGYVGHDHHSVGVFQQQVPGWGPVARAQNIHRATYSFLDALVNQSRGPLRHGPFSMKKVNAHDSGVLIQDVQISAFPDAYSKRANEAIAFRVKYFPRTRNP